MSALRRYLPPLASGILFGTGLTVGGMVDPVRVRGFLDLFNITNSNAAETRTITSGTAFLRPTAVLPPFTARVGARLSW